VPLHEGHDIDKDGEPAKNDGERDVSFAAFAGSADGAGQVIIAHNPNAKEGMRESAGSPIIFSTIRAANSAVM